MKNYLRTAFDKLGVWTRLELALYVASHGGANWHVQLGNGLLSPEAGWSRAAREEGLADARTGGCGSFRRNELEKSCESGGVARIFVKLMVVIAGSR